MRTLLSVNIELAAVREKILGGRPALITLKTSIAITIPIIKHL